MDGRCSRPFPDPIGMSDSSRSGGIGPANLANYLSLNNVAACGGSWMVETSLVAERNFSAVTELTRQAREIARSVP